MEIVINISSLNKLQYHWKDTRVTSGEDTGIRRCPFPPHTAKTRRAMNLKTKTSQKLAENGTG